MRLTEKVHEILKEHLQTGDRVIDATAGNGHDTLFLADQVGASGQVIAIDIQECAIQSTREKLFAASLEDRVTLYQRDHATQLVALCEQHHKGIAAIVFNLGYLPGSDKAVQTQSTNTRQALDAALLLIRPQGRLCVTAYCGHPGGAEEAQNVEDWMQAQQSIGHRVECHRPPSNNTPPVLWVLQVARG